MFIACTEKCSHQSEGICTKTDCGIKTEYISGDLICPHFEPKEENANKKEPFEPPSAQSLSVRLNKS